MKINHFGNLQTLKIAVVSSLAIGSVATICATPAQAVVVTGSVSFNDGALNVFGTIPSTPGPGSFIAGFNNNNVAIISRSTGSLGDLFPTGSKFVATSSLGLSYSSGSNYITTNDLIFDFGNDVGKLTIARNALFSASPNAAGTHSNFAYQGTAATFINGMDSTPLSLTSFNFDVDNISSTSSNPVNSSPNGSYSLVASVVTPTTAVPEPFTIIGTLVGGTAAIRTRKKLKAAAKV